MPQKKVQDVIVPINKGQATSPRRRATTPAPDIRPKSTGIPKKRPAPTLGRGADGASERRPDTPPVATPPGGGNQTPRYATLQRGGRPARSGRAKIALWGIVGVVLIVLFVAVSTFFEHATLKIIPQQQSVDLDFFFNAEQDADGESKVPFEVMTLSAVESVEVPATEVEQVDRRASGTITIFNDFSAANQRLVKNTRFETPDGRIYRIRESIDVPGQQEVDGQTIAGSVDAVVYADDVGEEYNMEATTFTIPGFKGTPRFDNFSAESQTPLAGGFSGVMMTVSDEELDRQQGQLQAAVEAQLLQSARVQKPEDFILFDDAVFVVFDEQSQEEGEGETVVISQNATLYGLIFDKEILSTHLAKKTLSQVGDDDQILIRNIDSLTFEVVSKQTVDPLNVEAFSFSLKGTPLFVWQFDESELTQAIKGLPKAQLKEVLKEFPSITRAEIVIRPFWKRSFPDTDEDVSIETVIE